MSLVGNLVDLGLGEILQIVSLSRKSGVLAIHSKEREGRIVFRKGQVVQATSSSYQQNLGEVLVNKGVIDTDTLGRALQVQQQSNFKERLGTILIHSFQISADTIEELVREQIENVVYSLFAWAEGTFDFELQDNIEVNDNMQFDPLQFMLEQGLNPQFLAMEGSRILDEMRHRGEEPDSLSVEIHTTSDENVDIAFDLLQTPEVIEQQPETEPIAAESRLLLVDDDAEVRDSISRELINRGYFVTSLEKSEEALIEIDTLYRNGQRPLLLLDLIMPRMDGSGILGGLELLELVSNNFPDLSTLVMADYHNNEAERKVRGMGYQFIIKPRKAEINDSAIVQAFNEKLTFELNRLATGADPVIISDKINIGDELRLEMGEAISSSSISPQSTGISLLRGMLEELNNPGLGGGIILLVLRFASEFMNRAVIFTVKHDEVVGLGQFGIEDSEGLADARVRNLRIPRQEDSVFKQVLETQLPMKLVPDNSRWNRYLFEQLGGHQGEVFLGPIVSEGKVVAVLYGDNGREIRSIGDTDSLEIFLSQAGMAMEKALLLRRLREQNPEGN